LKKALVLWVLTVFGLFGCINDNAPSGPKEATGVARIKLPKLPAGADSDSGSAYSLTITVTGPGMQALSHAWMLSDFGGQTVSFEDIPAGPNRVFTGILMRGAIKTHEGEYAVEIGGGETVLVPLVLRDVRTGRAEICVKVEGWPGSLNCMSIDTAADTSGLEGCWHIEAYDSLSRVGGTLSLHRMGGVIYGDLKAPSGQTLYATASMVDGSWRVTLRPMIYAVDFLDLRADAGQMPNIEMPYLPPDTGLFRGFQFRVDSFSFGPADQPNGLFRGVLMDSTFRKTIGTVTGVTAPCLVIDPPMIHPIDSVWIDTVRVDTAWVDTTRIIDTASVDGLIMRHPLSP
jgi:hypothetical protein